MSLYRKVISFVELYFLEEVFYVEISTKFSEVFYRIEKCVYILEVFKSSFFFDEIYYMRFSYAHIKKLWKRVELDTL